MSDLWLVICVNCGTQTMIDLNRPDDSCQFCGKNARQKEDIMGEKEAVEAVKTHNRGPVPPKPKNRKKLEGYWEENREAMVADYLSMRVSSFFLRWAISPTTWPKLREKWEVKTKTAGRLANRVKEPTQKAASEDVALSEHERYLILLGYRQAVREFLKIL